MRVSDKTSGVETRTLHGALKMRGVGVFGVEACAGHRVLAYRSGMTIPVLIGFTLKTPDGHFCFDKEQNLLNHEGLRSKAAARSLVLDGDDGR